MADVKNIIFDIGNVVIQWQPFEALKCYYASTDEMNTHLAEIGFFEWNVEQDRGRSFADGLNHARQHTDHAHIFEAYVNGLHLSHGRQISGTTNLIKTLSNKLVPIYGLSNITEEAYAIVLDTAPELYLLRHTTVSARVQMVKPEPEIFDYCLSQNELNPHETLFIDDSLENCKTAEVLGLRVHHFYDAEGLKSDLKRLRIL